MNKGHRRSKVDKFDFGVGIPIKESPSAKQEHKLSQADKLSLRSVDKTCIF